MFLKRLNLLDEQIVALDQLAAEALRPHTDAVKRLSGVPGFGVDSAQQTIAEVGVNAKTFPSAGEFASWVGTIPGSDESAEQNHSSRSPKGNRQLRRIFTQAAQAAVKKKGCHFQNLFRRLMPKLGFNGAIWAVANRLCKLVWKILHDGVSYIEHGTETNPKAKKRRAQKLAQALRRLGYSVVLTPVQTAASEGCAG
jgi:transposase